MLNIPAYVLRFWETEFPDLQPEKSEKGQRLYSEDDIATIRNIAQLRYAEKLTVSGARMKLKKPSDASTELAKLRNSIQVIKNSLQAILSELR